MPGLITTPLIILSPAALHREAWRALLSSQPGIDVLGTAGDIVQGGALTPPDGRAVVLLEAPASETEWVPQIKTAIPSCSVLALIPRYDLPLVLALLQAGAAGCVSQDESVSNLCRAIIAAGRDELVLPPAIASHALTALAQGRTPATSLVEPLSEREAQVVRLLAQGLTNKDIAQGLILSVRTVEAYLRSIYGKLGVRSRTEAALWATRNGFGSDR